MEMKHGMPVWAPTDEELAQIQRQVSKERAGAAQSFFATVREWVGGKSKQEVAIRPHGLKAPAYY